MRRELELVTHLTAREFRIRYAMTSLGWLWAVLPPYARLLVLGVVFTRVLPVEEPDYVALLAVGLLGWTWFSNGVSGATRSAVDRRDLLAQPDLPHHLAPLVRVLSAGLDYLAALPVLLVIVLVSAGSLPATVVLLPLLLVPMALLCLGLGMLGAAIDVRYRDSRLAVDMLLVLGFYMTPVFYTLDTVSGGLRTALSVNPVTALLEAQRDVLVRGDVPGGWPLVSALVVSAVVGAAGWWVHKRAAPTFLDHL